MIPFVPPFSEYELELIRQGGQWETFQNFKRQLASVAPFWDFSGYNEIARTILFTPTYVAITKGYFDEVGLDVTVATAQGGDKLLAIMLSNQADIALGGPDMAIYVHNSDSPVKFPIFCGLISTDGWMLMGREKVDKFDWSALKGLITLRHEGYVTPEEFDQMLAEEVRATIVSQPLAAGRDAVRTRISAGAGCLWNWLRTH